MFLPLVREITISLNGFIYHFCYVGEQCIDIINYAKILLCLLILNTCRNQRIKPPVDKMQPQFLSIDSFLSSFSSKKLFFSIIKIKQNKKIPLNKQIPKNLLYNFSLKFYSKEAQ